jgi:hypothetical protein
LARAASAGRKAGLTDLAVLDVELAGEECVSALRVLVTDLLDRPDTEEKFASMVTTAASARRRDLADLVAGLVVVK